jgi:hypothetical protein
MGVQIRRNRFGSAMSWQPSTGRATAWGTADEVRRADLTVVDHTDHHRVGDQRPELLSDGRRPGTDRT